MYQLLEHNSITVCDVDNTLVMWSSDFRTNKPGKTLFKYGGEDIYLKPHNFHVTFLKHCFERGDFVVVWSQNGYCWAKQIVDKLGLQDYVHVVASKPVRHIDDKMDLSDIVGNRIYIKDDAD